LNIGRKLNRFVKKVFPHLEKKLAMARMDDTPKSFLLKISIGSILFSAMLGVLTSWIFSMSISNSIIAGFFILLAVFIVLFSIPNFNIKKLEKEIESDIFITGRRLLTLLESGDALIRAIVEVSKARTKSSRYFSEIASEIHLGKSLEDSLNHGIQLSPSKSFKRILEEIKNSLKTGSAISKNLVSTLDDIYKSKVVQIEEYGKKLNPLCMFYMIFGAIIPSIGIVMIIVFLTLIHVRISLFILLFILSFVILIQLAFITLFSRMRPVVGY